MKTFLLFITMLLYIGCEKDVITELDDFATNEIQAVDSTKQDKPPDENSLPESQLTDTIHHETKILFEFEDIDGNQYHAIQIGEMIWSQENLKTTRYNDENPIINVQRNGMGNIKLRSLLLL